MLVNATEPIIWDKSTSRYIRNLLFEGSFKHYTGSSFKRLQHDTFDFLRAEWEKQDTCTQSPQYLSPAKETYTSYRYPQPINDSIVIAVKSGLKDINSLVIINNGREKHLDYIGSINSRLSYRTAGFTGAN